MSTIAKRTLTSIACLLIVGASTTDVPAMAWASQVDTLNHAPLSASAEPEFTRVSIPFSAPQTLRDAAQVSAVSGYPVLAFRFENAEIVGEYSVEGPTSVDEYLRSFDDMYGTQPQVVSAVIEVPVDVAQDQRSSVGTRILNAAGDPFVAAAVDEGKVDKLLASFRANNDESGPASSATGTDRDAVYSTWKPTQAQLEVRRTSSTVVNFWQYYYWDGLKTHNTALHPDDGWEGEINIYTSNAAYQTGLRGSPTCPTGYKERPFAKNYSWNWSALVNSGSGMVGVASSVGAYADYNDLSDACNRNSMAIGIRSPQNLPWYSSDYHQEVLLVIDAPRGLDSSGKISGVVQSVNETGCKLQPWLSNTDCMGVTTSTSGSRTTLNVSRGWIAPNKCWTSFDYGSSAPTAYC